MKKLTKIFAIALALLALTGILTSCRQSERVSANISKEADNFNVTRRLVAINTRSDRIIFEVIGNFAILSNSGGELEVVVEVGPGEYKKHFLYINKTWTAYTVEDISGANVSPYYYEINFLPEMIQPFGVTTND